jgi:hypothetical protein
VIVASETTAESHGLSVQQFSLTLFDGTNIQESQENVVKQYTVSWG